MMSCVVVNIYEQIEEIVIVYVCKWSLSNIN
jgi:hypothetical protein